MPASDYKKGQTVRIKAGIYPVHNDEGQSYGTFLFRGQEHKLTEFDLQRDDFDLVFEEVDADAPEQPVDDPTTSEYDVADTGFNYNDVTYEAVSKILEEAPSDEAKRFLSSDQWSYDGMTVAQQAEKDGKNRKTVNELITDRLLDLEEDEDGGPEG